VVLLIPIKYKILFFHILSKIKNLLLTIFVTMVVY
jgi:hypothetical protein